MAQMLEAQGTLVTVALLEGDPETLTEWAESYMSNDDFKNKLNMMFGSFSKTVNIRQNEYTLLYNVRLLYTQ